MTIRHAQLLKILFLLGLFLASTSGQALNSTNAKWLVFDRQGDITLGSAKKWQRDWTHATVLRHNLLLVYDRNSGNAKTAVISHDGTLQQPHTYKWTTIWSDVMPANFLNGVDANVVLYSRDTGALKAFKLETNKATLRFSQTIPNLVTNTDQAKGWDIVVPFNYSGVSRVMFYQRSTGTAQFYKYSSQSKTLEPQSTTTISNYWDQIAAGNFDDDDDQELVLHNQDGGEVRIWDPYAKTAKDLPNAGIAHTALLGVGEHYGGESRSDILLYQAHYRLSEDCGKARMNPVLIVGKPRTGSDPSCHGGGRAILYVDNKNGDYGIKSIDTGWRSDWTHLIANNYSFGLYSNARSVKLHFVAAGLNNDLAADEFTNSGIQRWIEGANRTFAAAGIEFMNAGQTVTQNQDLADFICGNSRNPLNAWSATNIPSDSIPIIIPHSNNKGCSSGRANFIAMTRPTGIRLNGKDADSTYEEWYRGNSIVTHDRPSPRGLAHELGHFFQLAHAYRTAKTTKSAIETMLKDEETATNHASIHNLDGDRYATTACSGKGGCYLATHDTMPAFSEGFWDNLGVDRCDDGPKYSFSSNLATFKYSAAPHDVMSYIRCDRTNVLSKDQVRAVRQSLYGLRNALIQ